MRISKSKSVVLAIFAAGLFSTSSLAGVASAAGQPGKADARSSVAELGALNLNQTDAVNLFGAGITVDSSTAGNSDLAKSKSVTGKFLYKLDRGMAAPLTTVASPDFTFIAPDSSYAFIFTSKAAPVNGNGEQVASEVLKVAMVAGGSDLVKNVKVSSQVRESNPSFPAGVYANIVNGSVSVSGKAYPMRMLEVVAGRGGGVATYALAYVGISRVANAPALYGKAFNQFEGIVASKITGGPVTKA